MFTIDSLISLGFSFIALLLSLVTFFMVEKEKYHNKKVDILTRINSLSSSLFTEIDKMKTISRNLLAESMSDSKKDNRATINKLLETISSSNSVLTSLDTFYDKIITSNNTYQNRSIVRNVELKLLQSENYFGKVKPLTDSLLNENHIQDTFAQQPVDER